MSVLARIKSIFKAKANSVINELENPEEALALSLVELKQKVNEIKKALLEVTTIKKGIERDLAEVEDQIRLAQNQAELAIEANREDLAQAALEKKQDFIKRKTAIQSEIEKLNEKNQIIIKSKEQLEKKVRDLENKKQELTAMNKAADAQLAVKEVLTGVSDNITEIGDRIERAENKINEKNARVSAIDELVDIGGLDELEPIDPIQKDLNDIQRQAKVKEELESLKNKLKKEEVK